MVIPDEHSGIAQEGKREMDGERRERREAVCA
jgi:hypothetical protein